MPRKTGSLRPVVVCACGDHAFVTCARGATAIIDPEDAPRVGERNWCVSRKGYVHARRPADACRRTGHGPYESLHNFICGGSPPPGKMRDHRDGNKKNNRKSNLRLATPAQNKMNSRASCAAGMKGVTKHGKRWRAQLVHTVGGVKKHFSLGSFDTVEEAACAYDRAALERFGAFARLNFPGAVEVRA